MSRAELPTLRLDPLPERMFAKAAKVTKDRIRRCAINFINFAPPPDWRLRQ